MKYLLSWILFLILPCAIVRSRPLNNQHNENLGHADQQLIYNANNAPKSDENAQSNDPQVISVRITSSVAVGRGRFNSNDTTDLTTVDTDVSTTEYTITTTTLSSKTDGLPDLAGANIEFIKQLNAKKGVRVLHSLENVHPFQLAIQHQQPNETDDSIAEPSLKSEFNIPNKDNENTPRNDNIPLGRSLSQSPKNFIQGLTQKQISERGNNQRLTTVSFNVLHDTPNGPSDTFSSPAQSFSQVQQYYNEPPKIYNQPVQIYSEPAKYYSEPSKIYSEPAKIYSEPAKVYSEPSKVYSEPARFYSEPASLHLTPNSDSWHQQAHASTNGFINTTPITTILTNPTTISETQRNFEHQPEKNYEVDEKVSVLTDGKSHGVQETSTESCKQDKCKVGYVVEGRQYRKYRVEERTPDGFIVGEYGVVRNEDGALRGVRYTADGDTSPRLIYDALMKFLQLR